MMKENCVNILEKLDQILRDRKEEKPENSYVSSLYEKGNVYVNEKILEEANEYIEATMNENKKHIVHEAADLWFHTLVSLSLNGISSNDILEELEMRFGVSGIDEKKLRNK